MSIDHRELISERLRTRSLNRDLAVEAADRIDQLKGHENDLFLQLDLAEKRIEELEASIVFLEELNDKMAKAKDARINELKDELLVEKGRIDEYRVREADDGRPFDVNTIAKLQVEREADDE